MAELSPEEAMKVEALQNFWKKYGKRISSLFLIMLFSVAGVQYWRAHLKTLAEAASLQYTKLWLDLQQGDMDSAKSKAQLLVDTYYRTPYGVLGALFLAQQAVEEKAYDKARIHLNWVIEQNSVPLLKTVATLRLARLLALDEQKEAALVLLEQLKKSSGKSRAFVSLAEEIRGDILASQQKIAAAREAYSEAYQLALGKEEKEAQEERPLLKLKVEQLGARSL